jgi:putative transposase
MKRKYSEKKIIKILNEVTAGAKVLETCRKCGISDATYYNWKSKYGGMSVSDVKKLKELESEKLKLKRLVADQALDILGLNDLVKNFCSPK